MTGFLKEERALIVIKIPRWIKTLFFLITMLISLLLFSAPLLVIIVDAFLPSAILSATLLPPSSLTTHLNNYDFRSSLIDIPLLSVIRSAIILCVYSLCDGPRLSRGAYLGVATVCAVASVVFVSFKASYVFMMNRCGGVTLLVCSLGLAVGHVAVAYRTSCRERRKLLLYKIHDVEALQVSPCKKVFPRYHPILQDGRLTK